MEMEHSSSDRTIMRANTSLFPGYAIQDQAVVEQMGWAFLMSSVKPDARAATPVTPNFRAISLTGVRCSEAADVRDRVEQQFHQFFVFPVISMVLSISAGQRHLS
jgi:hypothetical protein